MPSATDCTVTSSSSSPSAPTALTVKAAGGGRLSAAMSRSSLKVSVRLAPDAGTTPLNGTGGVVLATVELLVTGKSSKATASLPARSSMTPPVVGTA